MYLDALGNQLIPNAESALSLNNLPTVVRCQNNFAHLLATNNRSIVTNYGSSIIDSLSLKNYI